MIDFSFRLTQMSVQVAVAVAVLAISNNVSSQVLGSDGDGQSRALARPKLGSAATPASMKMNDAKDEVRPLGENDIANIPVMRFKLEGLSAYSADDVLATVAKTIPLEAGNYSLARVNEIADALQKVLREKGLIGASAVVPPQELSDGTVVIRVTEAKLSSSSYTQVETAQGETIFPVHQVAMNVVELTVKDQLCINSDITDCKQRGLYQADVERALLLAGEKSNSSVTGNLNVGDANSLSLDVTSKALPRVSAEVGYDNAGAPSTGTKRTQARLVIRELASPGDSLAIYALKSTTGASTDLSVDYSLYAGSSQWKTGVTAGQTQYQLGGDFVDLDGSGEAKTLAIYASYPVLRRLNAIADFRAEYQYAQLTDYLAGDVTKRVQNQIRIGLSGAFLDNFTGFKANSSWNLALVAASVTDKDVPESASVVDSVSRKLVTSLSRNQELGRGFQLTFNLAGQASNANLPGYGKLFLGGPGAVRAYVAGEAGGDSAVVGQAQLGWTGAIPYLGSTDWKWGLAGFYDRGWAKLQQRPAPSVQGNTVVLAGAGVEFALLKQDRFSLRIFYAHTAGTQASKVDGKVSRIGMTAGLSL